MFLSSCLMLYLTFSFFFQWFFLSSCSANIFIQLPSNLPTVPTYLPLILRSSSVLFNVFFNSMSLLLFHLRVYGVVFVSFFGACIPKLLLNFNAMWRIVMILTENCSETPWSIHGVGTLRKLNKAQINDSKSRLIDIPKIHAHIQTKQGSKWLWECKPTLNMQNVLCSLYLIYAPAEMATHSENNKYARRRQIYANNKNRTYTCTHSLKYSSVWHIRSSILDAFVRFWLSRFNEMMMMMHICKYLMSKHLHAIHSSFVFIEIACRRVRTKGEHIEIEIFSLIILLNWQKNHEGPLLNWQNR